MPVKFEKLTLLMLAILHLAVQLTHGYSHEMAEVPNTILQLIFILLIITIAPFVAVYIAWKVNIRIGAGLFALAMGGAFVFGYFFHFVMESPDFYANVIGDYQRIFFHSALNLAFFECVGLFFGIYVLLSRS